MTDKPHLYPDRTAKGTWFVINGELVDVPLGEEEKYLNPKNKKKPEDGTNAAKTED